MTTSFSTAAIVGVGLLGGSLGLALKKRNMAGKIRGVGRRQSNLDKALEAGIIDEAHLDIREGVKGVELVVLCTPASLAPAMLDEVMQACGPDTLITDVASTKELICNHAARLWPENRPFVGSHPMAGSEKHGPEHADANLYEGRITVIEDSPGPAAHAVTAIRALWEGVGARVVAMAPKRHDQLVAYSSHVPHLAAACVALCAADAGDEIRDVVGQGFRDVTRVAEGRPEIWRDICLTNHRSIIKGLDDLTQHLGIIRAAVAAMAPETIERFLESAQVARRKAIDE